MRFCPFCEKDFDDDVLMCPECGEPLLKGSYAENTVLFEHESEELILKLFNYLCEKECKTIQYFFNHDSSTYCLTADSSEELQSRDIMLYYVDNHVESELTEKEQNSVREQLSSMISDMIPDEGAKTFINAKDRYDDMMSSASSLIIVGLLGFVFIGLVYFQIIKLNMNVLFYILSGLMFAAFVITGIVSFVKAKNIKGTISEENDLAEQIKKFLLEEYQPVSAEHYSISDSSSEEEKYFARTEHMKKAVQEHFMGADELLIDAMMEDVYNTIYPVETH